MPVKWISMTKGPNSCEYSEFWNWFETEWKYEIEWPLNIECWTLDIEIIKYKTEKLKATEKYENGNRNHWTIIFANLVLFDYRTSHIIHSIRHDVMLEFRWKYYYNRLRGQCGATQKNNDIHIFCHLFILFVIIILECIHWVREKELFCFFSPVFFSLSAEHFILVWYFVQVVDLAHTHIIHMEFIQTHSQMHIHIVQCMFSTLFRTHYEAIAIFHDAMTQTKNY